MALITTVTPTVSTEDHIPGIPDDSETLAGNIDRNDIEGWGFDSTFAFPTPHFSITPDWGTPATDIGTGTVYRLEPDGQKKHVIGSETGVSLTGGGKNYVFYTSANEYEVHDADEPPSDEAVLIAVLDTAAETVDTDVRGRTPLPLAFVEPFGGGGGATGGAQVSTVGSDAIADTSARLQGSLDALGSATAVDVYFQYRVYSSGSSWSETSRVSKNAVGLFDARPTGLSADTQYVFRAVGLTPSGNVVLGNLDLFTTAAAGTNAPTIETDAATSVDSDGAQLNGDLTSLGSYSSGDTFHEWRSKDGSQAGVTPSASTSSTGTFANVLDIANPDTTYEFRAAFEYTDGTVYGDWLEFTTTSGTGLAVSTGSASNIGTNSADIDGTLDSLGAATSASVNFEYRVQGNSVWDATVVQYRTATGTYSDTLDQLVSGTTYEWRASAASSVASANGSTQTFTTDYTTESVDDFNDGDISEYAGNTSVFSVQTSTVYEGTHALEQASGGGGSFITSTSGLPRYPQAGDDFEYRLYFGGDETDMSFLYFCQHEGTDDDYFKMFVDTRSGQNDRFILQKVQGGATTLASNTSNEHPTGEWLRITIETTAGGSHTCTIYDASGTQISQISATDSTWSSGGVGYKGKSGNFIDAVTII